MGPFVDSDHPEVAGTQVSKTFDELFEDAVVKVASHLENLGTQIILVPSIRDVHHEAVFPQPPFELSPEARYPNLVLVSNPSTFRINGVSFGVVTHDVLRHLAGMSVQHKDTEKAIEGRDRVSQLAAHIIQQQRCALLVRTACPPLYYGR
jgi:DNA polymerase alpha subunit B